MNSAASSSRSPNRSRSSLILTFAVALGFGVAMPGQAVLAGVDGASTPKAQSGVAGDSRSSGAIVVAEKDGGKNWNNGKKNWNKGGNWNKNNKQWSGKKNQNYNKYYNKHWGKGWSNYNNQWNKNWNRRSYVRNWNRRPYYGEFVGGVVLGSLLAAAGAGVVPYAPEPYLCWYWADPYMYRGYWDYCD